MIKSPAFILYCATLAACAASAEAHSPQHHLQRNATESADTPQSKLKDVQDADYAWDNFRHRSTIIWGCREIKTGEFVSNRFCKNEEKIDSRWPGMEIPPTYRGQIVG